MPTRSTRRALASLTTAVALAAGLTAGTGAAASAQSIATSHASSGAQSPTTATFALFVPNAPVSFTTDGALVGTGSTNRSGDVTFTFTPAGLVPGYYRFVAATSYGITISIRFWVQAS